MLNFDKRIIYIMGMERWNDIKFNPIVVVALFVCGMLVPVLSENVVIIALCMVPFYGYVFYKCFVLGEAVFSDFKSKEVVSRRFYISLLVIFSVDFFVSVAVGFSCVLLSLILNSAVAMLFVIVSFAFLAWCDYDPNHPDHGTVLYWDDNF